MSAFGATLCKHVCFTRQSNQCRFWQLIWATWSYFLGRQNSRLERLTKREYLDVGRGWRYITLLLGAIVLIGMKYEL